MFYLSIISANFTATYCLNSGVTLRPVTSLVETSTLSRRNDAFVGFGTDAEKKNFISIFENISFMEFFIKYVSFLFENKMHWQGKD